MPTPHPWALGMRLFFESQGVLLESQLALARLVHRLAVGEVEGSPAAPPDASPAAPRYGLRLLR